MRAFWKSLVDFFASLQLTVVLLTFSIVLVFVATLDQVNLGVWAVQAKYFRSFFVMWQVPGSQVTLPSFPGGYLIGGLLFLNLLAAQIVRLQWSWRKLGLHLTHTGLIVLLVGEFVSGVAQEEFQMQLTEGETKNYSESFHLNELAVIDTSNQDFDEVVAIPEALLKQGKSIQHPKLPFRILVKEYYANSLLKMKRENAPGATTTATSGIGVRIDAAELPVTYKSDERNSPSAFIEIFGSEGSLGTYLVSPQLAMLQQVSVGGRNYTLSMRVAREYKPFSLTLLELKHDVYPGSDIPKNFSSKVRLKSQDGKEDRDVVIFMNNPLRYGGLTFYQYQMDQASHYSVLQVVRNPGWLLPYISCVMMGAGLLLHFCISLAGFVAGRKNQTA